MAFASNFGRILSPTFHPNSQAKKAGDWWLAGGIDPDDCVAAYQPKGAASYAASLVNLTGDDTYDAVKITNDPSWNTATGWTFVANNDWLDTAVVPAAGYSFIISFSNIDNTSASGCGVFSSPIRFYLRPTNSTTTQRAYGYGNKYAFIDGNLTSGVMAICGDQPYLNGSADGSALGATWNTTTLSIYLGKENGYFTYFKGNILAAAIYNATLTSGQVSALSTAMAAL